MNAKEFAELIRERDELAEKRKELKEKAAQHREDPEALGGIRTELAEINDRFDEVHRAIETEQVRKKEEEKKESERNMEKLLKYREDMDAREIPQTEEYRSAFFKRLRRMELNEVEQRAMTSASSSAGAAIPTQTMDMILGQLAEPSTLLNSVTMLNIPDLLSLPVESTTTDANWVGEGADSTPGDDTIGQISLSAYTLIRTVKITAKLQRMSIDAFEAWIVSTMVKKMRAAIEKAIVSGTGTNQPSGIEKITWGATNSMTSSADITFDNLVDLETLVEEDYIGSAAFYMNRKTLAKVRKLKDDAKRPLFERAVEDGFRGTVNGIPVKTSKYIADDVIYLGDLKSAYVLNFAAPIEIANSTEAGFMSGSTVYRAMALLDGKPTGVKGAIAKWSKTGAAG